MNSRLAKSLHTRQLDKLAPGQRCTPAKAERDICGCDTGGRKRQSDGYSQHFLGSDETVDSCLSLGLYSEKFATVFPREFGGRRSSLCVVFGSVVVLLGDDKFPGVAPYLHYYTSTKRDKKKLTVRGQQEAGRAYRPTASILPGGQRQKLKGVKFPRRPVRADVNDGASSYDLAGPQCGLRMQPRQLTRK